ncbi:hypothetical protein [Colwellia sp. BRX8-9]|nr:hypothetical protein [Colwellia sp. BRX8-9]MBA6348034.1 hypothetical protein [Colwellia sp. BRX8-9]
MGKVTGKTQGTSSTTGATDRAAWEALSSNTEDLGDHITQIIANDSDVDNAATSVVENKEYSYTGVNSNSAASAVADKAQGSTVILPDSLKSSPGNSNRDQVEFKDKEIN